MKNMQAKNQSKKHPPREAANLKVWQDNLNEAFRKENAAGTWTIEQLTEMQNEFNNLTADNEQQQRRLILYRFFNANIISHIIIGKFKLVSEDAQRKDLLAAQFDLLHRSDLISQNFSQFSDIRFGPPGEKKRDPKHDEHVKAFEHSKLPLPYQRRYAKEPEFTVAINIARNNDNQFEIHIGHLVKTGGFCRCVKLTHRETLHAIPIKKVIAMQLHPNKADSFDLHLELMK